MCVLKGNKMFGEYLREKRKGAKLSQQGLADKITSLGYKCSNGLISYYETGYGKTAKNWTGRPPEEFLDYLAKALELDLDEVRSKAGYASTTQLQPQQQQVIETLGHSKNLTPKDYETIKNMIEFLDSQPKE